MYDSLKDSDIFYYLFPVLFGGLIVYVIKKLLSFSYRRQNLTVSDDNSPVIFEPNCEDRNPTNNNHLPNGKTVKQNGFQTHDNSSQVNKESEVSEVFEEVNKCESSSQLLEKELNISCDNLDKFLNDIHLDDKTTEVEVIEEQEVIELIKEQNIKVFEEQKEEEQQIVEQFRPQVYENFTKTTIEDNNHLFEEQLPKVNDLAAIILTDDKRVNWCEIVCITSGSGIIEGHNLEPEFVVVDSRAPVLARRCLLRYLYHKLNQLIKQEISEEESLFTCIPASNRFKLKDNYKISLYLSEPPDSSFTKSMTIINEIVGDESGKGSQMIRLKSTTDKISIWNQVGLQGSLLSHFVDAIHLNSVIIPVEFNQKSFHQHFLNNYTKEPTLKICEHNLIEDITEQIRRVRFNNPDQSLATNWIKTENNLEIIDCNTGKSIDNELTDCTVEEKLSISRLSKHELNNCFKDFLVNYEHSLRPHQSLPMTYRKWKESAPNYRIQKQLLSVRFAVAGRDWTTLPTDLDQFV